MALVRWKGPFEELLKTFEECREPYWDGYSAQSVREETYDLAHQFLGALPLSTPLPSMALNLTGRSLWNGIASPQRTLSVSISPEGELHFAALLDSAKTYGTEPFIGAVPKVVADLIHRVAAA